MSTAHKSLLGVYVKLHSMSVLKTVVVVVVSCPLATEGGEKKEAFLLKSIFTLFLNNLILIHKSRDWSPNTIFTVYGLFHSGIVYNLITEALTLLILCDWQHRQVSRRMPACYLDLKRMWTAKTWTEVRPYAKLVTQTLILQKAIQKKHHRRRHLPSRQFSCALKIPEALTIFICKDAFLYSPVENMGLTSLASTVEPCYSFLLHISVKWQPQTCMHNWNGALWLVICGVVYAVKALKPLW